MTEQHRLPTCWVCAFANFYRGLRYSWLKHRNSILAHRWVSGSRRSEGTQCLHPSGQAAQDDKLILLDCVPLQDEVTQHIIAEGLNT